MMTHRMKLLAVYAAAALVMLTGFSCFDPDEEKPKPAPPQGPVYRDLTQQDHVLYNLELSYNQLNYARYEELLDETDFTFVFSMSDFYSGNSPRQWDKTDELAATSKMLDANSSYFKVLSMDLKLDEATSEWQETTPDQSQHPGETWYYKNVNYDLTMVVEAQPENITYLAQDLHAVIYIRQVDKGTKQVWQIVKWCDDMFAISANSTNPQKTASVKDHTWGRIKCIYFEGSWYKDLTKKDDVLYNLDLSYNQRNYPQYARLLDENHFTYFFSDEDYLSGRTPEQWGRADDLTSHQNMFNRYHQPIRVLSIRLALQYPAGQWIATTPDQEQFPGETWYYMSVSYDLTVVVEAQPENITYLAQNLKALFVIRQVEKDGKSIWQIVEWRDDVQIVATSDGDPEGVAATGESSWGSVKALFN